MALPANVSFGTVTGRFLTATADSPTDTDRDPEGNPATDLRIVFAPNVTPAVVRDASATPPTIFALAEIPATVGASGDLIGADGQPGIRLVATTGTTIDPSGWTWKVTLSSPTFPALSFSFSLDPGQSIDLATVVQVPASPGATLAAWLQAVADANAAADRAEAAAATAGGGGASDADIAGFVTDPGSATGTALAARYAPLELRPLPVAVAQPPVAVTANTNMDTLWPSWWGAGASNILDLGAMDAATFGPYFGGAAPVKSSWWAVTPAIYTSVSLNAGTYPMWAVGVRVTGSTRLLFGMSVAIGAETAGQFIIEIDGQKSTRRYVDTGIVYDGHKAGLLLTFSDTRTHDVRVYSRAGFTHIIAETGSTLTGLPAPFGGKKRLFINGDSWTEGTAQAASAVSFAAMTQLAADWTVGFLGNGGTGYVQTNQAWQSVFGSTTRLAEITNFAPDLFVFLGSINDGEDTADAVQAAAAAAFASLASSLPNAKGIIIGPQLPGHPLVGAALEAAANAAPNVLAYIDPVASGWIVPGVTGPTDSGHPSAVGAEHLAARLIKAIRETTVAHGDTSW